MKLYGAIASPYVTRVLMFARLKGIELEMPEMPGSPRSDEYRALNPIGKIPALETDSGQVIPESETICEYLEDEHPEPSAMPADALGRATSRTVSRIVDLYIAPHTSTMVRQVSPDKRDPEVVARVKTDLENSFHYLEHFMGSGPFAVADKPTLGDCAAAPYFMLMKKLVFANFDEIADPTNDGRLGDWWNAVMANEVCKSTVDEYATAVDGFLKFLMKQVS